ncbi:MAG TPA: hypothetical protein P5057_09745, partial [Acidobacteriota bacterium]|nr:hypothetical protein [Acidobacteriota bacterium]
MLVTEASLTEGREGGTRIVRDQEPVRKSPALPVVFCLLIVGDAVGLAQVVRSRDQAPPVERSAEEDHRAMLDLLGIKLLRPGADPRNLNAPNAANYDEAKANPYPCLPDP